MTENCARGNSSMIRFVSLPMDLFYLRIQTVGVSIEDDIHTTTACSRNHRVLVSQINSHDTHGLATIWFEKVWYRSVSRDETMAQ